MRIGSQVQTEKGSMTDHVMHVVAAVSDDGMGNLIASRIEALAGAQIEQSLVIIGQQDPMKFNYQRVAATGCTVYDGSFSSKGRRRITQSLIASIRWMSYERPSIVLVWGMYPLIGAWIATRSRSCTLVTDWVGTNQVPSRLHTLGMRYMTDKILAVSEVARDTAVGILGNKYRDRVQVSYPPIDPSLIRGRLGSLEQLQIGELPSSGPLIGSVGRLVDDKGFDRIIDAMPGVLLAYPDAILVIIGDGPKRRSLERRAEQLDVRENVVFLGNIAAGGRLFRICNVAVMPSRHEGLVGYAAIEAVSLYCPAIVSQIPAVTEIFDASHGVEIVDCTEPKLLSRSVIKVLEMSEEQKQRAVQRAAARLEQLFSYESYISNFQQMMTS